MGIIMDEWIWKYTHNTHPTVEPNVRIVFQLIDEKKSFNKSLYDMKLVTSAKRMHASNFKYPINLNEWSKVIII